VLVFATGTGWSAVHSACTGSRATGSATAASTDLARYLHACPVNRHVLDSDAPFFWSKRQGVRGERYQVVKQPRGEGLHGLQVPVFGTTGLEGAISLPDSDRCIGQRAPAAGSCCTAHSVPLAGLPRRPASFPEVL
jgi:hypothetical protein